MLIKSARDIWSLAEAQALVAETALAAARALAALLRHSARLPVVAVVHCSRALGLSGAVLGASGLPGKHWPRWF